MNIRQTLALLGVLIVLALIAMGLTYILPAPQQPQEAMDITEKARFALDLTDAAHLTVEAEERDYYALGVYPNGLEQGGGYIAIVHDTPQGVRVIAQGQEPPACTLVEPANVPVELLSHCMDEQGQLVERALD